MKDLVQRRHASLVLGSLLELALDSLGLELVRADKISQPAMITAQVIEYIAKAPLVVADLSFGNPNVYYKLASGMLAGSLRFSSFVHRITCPSM
ncbi:MAG: hypothetical protein ACRDTG_27825 [Pseudonocardiaceae bacterium]